MDVQVETQPKLDTNLKSEIEAKKVNLVDNEKEPVSKKPRLSENEDSRPKPTQSKMEPQPSGSREEPEPSESKMNESTKSKKCEDEDDEDVEFEHEIPEEGFHYPLEQDASDMLDETDYDGYFPPPSERYYTSYYQLDAVKPGDDVCIKIHSNRVCMISIAPSHTIFQENKTIEKCNYKVSEKLDRLQNKVSGKAKHGAQPLQANSNLCCLTCTDGSNYMIKCCIIGKLIEVNERLVDNPQLLKEDPESGGYIALVLPNLKHLDRIKDKLLTQELYEKAIEKRKKKKEEENKQDFYMEMEDKTIDQVKKEGRKEDNIRSAQTVKNKINENNGLCTSVITVDDKQNVLTSKKVISMEIVES